MCQVLDTFREWKANTRACVQRTLGCPAKGGFESTEGHAAAHSLPAAARCSSWETLDLTRFQTSLAEKWKTYADLHIWFVLLANLIMPRNQCTVAVKSAIFLTCPHRWTFWLIYIYVYIFMMIYICVCPLMFTFKIYIYIYILVLKAAVSKVLSHVDCVCLSEGWGSSCHSHPFNEVRGHGLPQWLVDYVVDKATPYWLANCLERRHFARWDDSWKLRRNKQEENPKDLAFRARKIGKKSKERHTRETLTVRKNRQLWKRKRKEGFAMFVHWKQSSVCRIWATSRQSAAVPRVTWVAWANRSCGKEWQSKFIANAKQKNAVARWIVSHSLVFSCPVYPGDCLLSKFILQWQLTQTLEVVRHLALWGKRSCSAVEWKFWHACMILVDAWSTSWPLAMWKPPTSWPSRVWLQLCAIH